MLAALVEARYFRLPKRGKPKADGSQWTILAGFVLEDSPRPRQVVALATGTKCVGGLDFDVAQPRDDTLVCDSHAEVLARRALLRWLLDQASLSVGMPSRSVFERPPSGGRLRLRDGVRLHMYVSQAPCGDATITRDGGSTGAHPVEWERYGRHDGTTPGILRTKPGKGAAAHSLSCSDKLAIWNVVGLQGALLSHLVEPIFLSSIAVGDGFCRHAMERALWHRTHSGAPCALACRPARSDGDAPFSESRAGLTALAGIAGAAEPQPCGHSVNWYRSAIGSGAGGSLPAELAHFAVYVEAEATLAKTGLKIGTTKKDRRLLPAPAPRCRSRLCRRAVLREFSAVCRRLRSRGNAFPDAVADAIADAAADAVTHEAADAGADAADGGKALTRLLEELEALVAAPGGGTHAAEAGAQEEWSRVHRALKEAATAYQTTKEALRLERFSAWRRRRAGARTRAEQSAPEHAAAGAAMTTRADGTRPAAQGTAAVVEPPRKKLRARSADPSTSS